MRPRHWIAVRVLSAVLTVLAALLLLPGTAAADVGVAASWAAAGARNETITFRVTNDDPAVPTTRLAVFLPTVRPMIGVVPTAPTGWTPVLSTAVPSTPIVTEDGPVTEIVTAIAWEGGTIEGSDYAVFPIDVDRLPEGAGPLRFRVLQTFVDGTTVEWSDIVPSGKPPPAHPSLVVPYAGVNALPPAPPDGGDHHGSGHGGASAADQAILPAGGGSVQWTFGVLAAVAAVVAVLSTWLARRQRRRLAIAWAGVASDDGVQEHRPTS